MKILGIEGGGTKTTWTLIDSKTEAVLASGQRGPGNVQLLSRAGVHELLSGIQTDCPETKEAVGVGGAFAGCQLPQEKKMVEDVLREIWGAKTRVFAGEDSRSALAGAFGNNGSGIIVIAGTGSNVVGSRPGHPKLEKVTGWGHLFADRGSSYDLSRSGMELAYEEYDSTGKTSILAEEYLRLCGKSDLEELVPFLLLDLTKNVVASRAPAVFAAAERGHEGARALISDRAYYLADRVRIIANRLSLSAPGVAVTGGLFENQPGYFRLFQEALSTLVPKARSFILTTPGSVGAARLVMDDAPATSTADALSVEVTQIQPLTEQRNPRSHGLDKKSVSELVSLFLEEEVWVDRALRSQQAAITQAATLVSEALSAGGRLIYLGAGTSGRLGVVDASEMPPTFNASPDEIQALIAGGTAAVFKSQEGAEDSTTAAAEELKERKLTASDIVCGIAASGQTPYVLGGLAYAKGVGAKTLFLTCNPFRKISVTVDVAIDLATGPEIVTGSTRLKAGTATKRVLNILSSVAMIKLGRVQDNLMVNVQATNEKLHGRAIRLVMTITGCGETEAEQRLEKHHWRVVPASQ